MLWILYMANSLLLFHYFFQGFSLFFQLLAVSLTLICSTLFACMNLGKTVELPRVLEIGDLMWEFLYTTLHVPSAFGGRAELGGDASHTFSHSVLAAITPVERVNGTTRTGVWCEANPPSA